MTQVTIDGDLSIVSGSSGWTRTSNPPVNSCVALISPRIVPPELRATNPSVTARFLMITW